MESGNGLWYNLDLSLLQNILLIFLSVVLIWLKRFLSGEFDDVKTNLNNSNKILNKIDSDISNLNININTHLQKNAQSQSSHIHLHHMPDVIKTMPEEIKEASNQNESFG